MLHSPTIAAQEDNEHLESSVTNLKERLRAYTYEMPDQSVRGKRVTRSAMSVKVEDDTTPRKPAVKPEPSTTPVNRRKRGAQDASIETSPGSSSKKRRSTTKERSAADPHDPDNKLVDSLRPGLKLVFIGLNPGLTTAATGHAYAHPSNLFWKLLHWSGVTPVKHSPSETHDLMDLYSIGNTNICQRPTRSGDGLTKEEMQDGAGTLEEKIRLMKPEVVCIVGKGIWDTIYKVKTGKTLKTADFAYGWQKEELWLGKTIDQDGQENWVGSRTFVTTTTSGLAANMTPQQKLDIWKPLGQWMQECSETVVKEES